MYNIKTKGRQDKGWQRWVADVWLINGFSYFGENTVKKKKYRSGFTLTFK